MIADNKAKTIYAVRYLMTKNTKLGTVTEERTDNLIAKDAEDAVALVKKFHGKRGKITFTILYSSLLGHLTI